ncbi:carbohydrate ABC transporter membrane protein 2 (CUT1 family) [Haloactinopolyspora alba]|uniref:Carbohydrate ABC transporter membrane protein 2 (CUT1 family) n=1 Tax=Haloactinopolyspora alba TaxID=648780 RepID=A0A2P8E990_9ACTN|nr:carbohydrate ABC transporter permease [Haloactinopolyspora alba]PSL06042.1 carbohydrate ABC transporter membrane protein 2 (CUT1 family) [Haloactinopolyspora alba]
MSTDIVTRRRRRFAGVYLGYLIAALIFSGPVLFMWWSAFRHNVDITGSIFDITAPLTFENFTNLFDRFAFLYYIRNSFIIAGGSTLAGLVLGAPAAYVIVRRKMAGLGFLTLLARMAPGVLFVLPLFILSVNIGAPSNTALNFALLISAHLIITLPLCIWLLVPFFEDIPVSLEEAAMLDGCSVWDRFRAVVLPLVLPGLSVAVTLSFIFSWNYFLFALALANNDTLPLPVIAFNFIGQGASDYGGLMAASALISLPALILTIFAQRWLVRGITGGAVK